MSDISIVIPFRDRSPERLKTLLRSVFSNDRDIEVTIVDYGSSPYYREALAQSMLNQPVRVERMEAEGLPWNKCRAINRGVRLSTRSLICTLDADVYFAQDSLPLAAEIAEQNGKTAVHMETYWLARDGNEKKARPAGRGNPGAFQLVAKSAFDELGGYDERIVYWGLEDLDWPFRLARSGYEQTWLPEPHRLFHQWHPRVDSGHFRPITASYDTMRHCAENQLNPRSEREWGSALGMEDRPILAAMRRGSDSELSFAPNALMHYGNLERITETRNPGNLVSVKLGRRIIKRPLSFAADAVRALMRPAGALAGLDVTTKRNWSFDYLYSFVPALRSQGLADYYFAADASRAWLLWG